MAAMYLRKDNSCHFSFTDASLYAEDNPGQSRTVEKQENFVFHKKKKKKNGIKQDEDELSTQLHKIY